MQGYWQDSEVKSLFEVVKQIKDNNKPLSYAFVLHANKYNRKHGSVKNYYYFELKTLQNNPDRQQRLGIDLQYYLSQTHIAFNDIDRDNLIQTIDNNLVKGKSVRSTCCTLAQGDIKQMQRYQNKYYHTKKQSTIKHDDKVVSIVEHKGKVLNALTDRDIAALFLGLIRLIKSEATKEVNAQLKRECEFATANYQKVLNLLKYKESEVDKLKSINKALNDQITHLKSKN